MACEMAGFGTHLEADWFAVIENVSTTRMDACERAVAFNSKDAKEGA